jgi:hypothetical protein
MKIPKRSDPVVQHARKEGYLLHDSQVGSEVTLEQRYGTIECCEKTPERLAGDVFDPPSVVQHVETV